MPSPYLYTCSRVPYSTRLHTQWNQSFLVLIYLFLEISKQSKNTDIHHSGYIKFAANRESGQHVWDHDPGSHAASEFTRVCCPCAVYSYRKTTAYRGKHKYKLFNY